MLCFYDLNAIRVSCRAARTVKSSRDIHVLTQYDGAKRTWWLAVFGALKRSKKLLVCEELGVMLQAHVTSDTWQQVLCFYALNAIHVS